MKYFLWLIIIICHLNLGLAHNPHECFFDIKIEKQSCTISAEFPWTLRNALIQQTPALTDAKSTFWHSSAHLMAEAVETIFPSVKFWVGPPVDNGFYYDMDLGDKKMNEDDLIALEKKMNELDG